jgi:hypothetical protein
MRNPKSSNKRGPQMRQRVTQKHTMRNVVIASSILGCMAVALVVVNLSSNESSYANNGIQQNTITYRTTDMHLTQRMLIDPAKFNKQELLEYKDNGGQASAVIESRATDVKTIGKNKASIQ